MRLLLGGLILLAALHYVLAVSAIRHKSATFDEPMHALGAHLRWHFGDFRVNPEDPPLWHYLAVLGTPRDALDIDFQNPNLGATLDTIDQQWPFVYETLFVRNAVVVHDWINSLRARMALFGSALVVAVGLAAWSLARHLGLPHPLLGAWAASTLVALDPNFIGHSPILKNDVAVTLGVLVVSWMLWGIGRGITPARVAGLSLALALTLNLKFTGVVLAPAVVGLLVVRALLPTPWRFMRRDLTTRLDKVLAACAIGTIAACVCWASVWVVYGLRHAPGPDPSAHFNHEQHLTMSVEVRRSILYEAGRDVEASQVVPTLGDSILAWLGSTRLMPDAWTFGVHYVQARSIARSSFLMGETTTTGRWYYFPVAMAVKTPLTTILMLAAASVWAARSVSKGRIVDQTWTLVAFAGPAAILFALAMSSALNLGIRHVFPVYPVIWLSIGLAVASLSLQRARVASVIALAGSSVEVARQAPDHLAFFNALAGGSTGGARILSDSNLDWGQDLPLLARWQSQNPDRKLYLSYFGLADPRVYGIRFINVAPGYLFGPPPVFPTPGEPAVLAVSITHMQGTYTSDLALRDAWRRIWREAKPLAVLGGTIYLYEFPLRLETDATQSPPLDR
jgi:hypothetical protein